MIEIVVAWILFGFGGGFITGLLLYYHALWNSDDPKLRAAYREHMDSKRLKREGLRNG